MTVNDGGSSGRRVRAADGSETRTRIEDGSRGRGPRLGAPTRSAQQGFLDEDVDPRRGAASAGASMEPPRRPPRRADRMARLRPRLTQIVGAARLRLAADRVAGGRRAGRVAASSCGSRGGTRRPVRPGGARRNRIRGRICVQTSRFDCATVGNGSARQNGVASRAPAAPATNSRRPLSSRAPRKPRVSPAPSRPPIARRAARDGHRPARPRSRCSKANAR